MNFRRRYRDAVQFLRYVVQRFNEDKCTRSAAALTYMSLFAVVPLMTVIYAMFAAIPAFQSVGAEIQNMVFEHFVPDTGAEVQTYLKDFSQQARTLTGVGVGFLLVTAVLMLKNIEKTFNVIWRTRDNRSGISSFLLYWALLSLGPLCIGIALAISTYVASIRFIYDQVEAVGIIRVLPYLFTCAAFTLMYVAVPNCSVRFKYGVIGGIVAGLGFEIAKQLFALTMATSSYTVIYGAFAALPLFLVWIYLSWLIVLAGAELVHALASYDNHRTRHFSDLTLALAVLELLWRRHRHGGQVSETELMRKPVLFDRYSIAGERWEKLRDVLLDAKLLQVADNGRYLLGRDLHHFTLWELIELLRLTPGQDQGSDRIDAPWLQRCQQLLHDAKSHSHELLTQPLATLFAGNQESTQQGVN